MKNDYSKIIDNITFASKHNNLTFFVGAGVSRCSGFDFLINPECFPSEQFNIKWIYNQSSIVHDYFSKNENTRKVINKAITKTLQENNCKYADKKYLTDLYFKYYSYGVY